MFLVTCMQNSSPSACLWEKQPPLEPPVAPHSPQGVGRGLWDPACLSLLFPVKASLVSQKLPSTCWVQSPCSPVSWLGESVVRKRVLSLMCGSGNHQPVVPSWRWWSHRYLDLNQGPTTYSFCDHGQVTYTLLDLVSWIEEDDDPTLR